MQLCAHTNTVTCLALHKKVKRSLVSGSADNTICVWDMLKVKNLQRFNAHDSQVSNIRYLPTNDMFASSSWDNTICIYTVEYLVDDMGKYVSGLKAHKK